MSCYCLDCPTIVLTVLLLSWLSCYCLECPVIVLTVLLLSWVSCYCLDCLVIVLTVLCCQWVSFVCCPDILCLKLNVISFQLCIDLAVLFIIVLTACVANELPVIVLTVLLFSWLSYVANQLWLSSLSFVLNKLPWLSSLSYGCPDCPVLPASRLLYWFSSHMTLWMSISFHLAITLNLLVAFFYPFGGEDKGTYPSFSPWQHIGSWFYFHNGSSFLAKPTDDRHCSQLVGGHCKKFGHKMAALVWPIGDSFDWLIDNNFLVGTIFHSYSVYISHTKH